MRQEEKYMSIEDTLRAAEAAGVKFQIARDLGDTCDGALVVVGPEDIDKSLDRSIWFHREFIRGRIRARHQNSR